MLYQQLNARKQAFLMLALMIESSQVEEIVSHYEGEEASLMFEALKELRAEKSLPIERLALNEIKKLSLYSRPNPLTSVHTDWILQWLQKESPRMIATLLRYFPADKIRDILDGLPEELLQSMPPLSESFCLDPELIQILRKKFEEQIAVKIPPQRSSEFESLFFLKPAEMIDLIRAMGFREVALAFKTLTPQTIEVIISRLPSRDAQNLKEQLVHEEIVQDSRLRQAQAHLLSLDLEKEASKNFIIEIGLFVFSKAFTSNHQPYFKGLLQKIPLEMAANLKKYIDKNIPLNTPQSSFKYQNEILKIKESWFFGKKKLQ